jgi:hypothetical protein
MVIILVVTIGYLSNQPIDFEANAHADNQKGENKSCRQDFRDFLISSGNARIYH